MNQHGPTVLEGPVSRMRTWWHQDEPLSQEPLEGASGLTDDSSGGSAEMRHDLIARVRREIAAGTYDTVEKWEAALDRLLEDMADG